MPEQAQTIGGMRANERFDTSGVNTSQNSNRTAQENNGTQMHNEFEGNTPDIGGILSLPAESHIKARVSYTKFRDLLPTYIVKNFREMVKVVNSIKTSKIQLTHLRRNTNQ